MKRIRRMSVNLGLKKVEKRVDPSDGAAYTEEEFEEVYGPDSEEWASAQPEAAGPESGDGQAAARPPSADEFGAAPGASAMPDFLANAGQWKAPTVEVEPEPEVEPAPKGFKGKLRRMSVTMLSPLVKPDDPADKYAEGQEPTVMGLPQSQAAALASATGASPKKEGLLGRARRASVTMLNLGAEPAAPTEGLQAALEAEKAALQEVEEEERKKRLMLEQQRIERERMEKMKEAEKVTEEAEYRNQELIRLRHEQLAEEEALAEREENLRRMRLAKEREQKEKAQQRAEEQKARMMGNRDQKREAAWKLYQQQMERAAQSGDGSGQPSGVAQGADLLWRIVAPGATVCDMEAAKGEIMEHVNGLAPAKMVRGKLQRNKLVVVGLGGPAGAGKTMLAGRLKDDCDALVLPLASFSEAGEHPSQLNADLISKAVLDLRATFKAELPMDVERDLEAEANMESIRRKLYAASYSSGGQDWHRLFQSVDKDKSGELGFPEFRIAVRKGAKLSPTVVTDESLKILFKAVDADGSGEINAQEFANFLNTKNRNAEDAYGKKRSRVVDCPPSRLLVLEGSNVFHPALVRHLDVQVFLTGPPHLHVARAMAREIEETKLPPHKILASIAGSRGPVQALHANKSASQAHILVRNQWSPILATGPAQANQTPDRAGSRGGSRPASRASGTGARPASRSGRQNVQASQLAGQTLGTCGGPVHSMVIERGESVESWSRLVDWIRGSVRQSAGVCVSHGRHTTIHSAFPLIGDETGNALRGLQGKASRANDGGDGDGSDEEVDRANAKERKSDEPSTLFRGVQLDSLPPWPDEPTDPMPPVLNFTRATLLPPRDPLDDGSDDSKFSHERPRRWIAMHDMGGLFTYTFCEREVEPEPEEEPAAVDEDDDEDDNGDDRGGGDKPKSKSKRRRKHKGDGPTVAKADSSSAWPILGESSSVTSLLGLGYTLTNLEEVQAHVFVVPTNHLKHSGKARPLLPFAAKAKQAMKEKEAAARRERKKLKEEAFKEEQKNLPVWKRNKNQQMEHTTQSFGDTQATLGQTMASLESGQVTQSALGETGMRTTKTLASEADAGGNPGDGDEGEGDAKKQRKRKKKTAGPTLKQRVAAKKAKALAKEQEEKEASQHDRSVMIVVERVVTQGDNTAGTIPKVYIRIEGGNKKDVEVVSRLMVLGTMMCSTRGKTRVTANRDGVVRGLGQQIMTTETKLPYINPWRPPSATPTNSRVSSAAPAVGGLALALPALEIALPGERRTLRSREGSRAGSRTGSRSGSRAGGRTGSRSGSRASSRAASRTGSRPGSRGGVSGSSRAPPLKPPRRIRSDPKFMREEAIRREQMRAEKKAAQKRAKEIEIERQKMAEMESVNALARQGGRWSMSRPCYEGLLTMDITMPSESDSGEEDDFDTVDGPDGGVEQQGQGARGAAKKDVIIQEHIDRSEIERNAEGCEEPHSEEPELWNIDGTECDISAKYRVGGQMWYLQSRALDAIKADRPIAGSPMNRTAVLSHRQYKADEPKQKPPTEQATGATTGTADDDGSAVPAAESVDDAPVEAKKKKKRKPEKIDRSEIERNAEGCEEPHSEEPELWNIDGTECDISAKYQVGGQMWYLQSRALDAIKKQRPIAGSPMNQAAVDAERKYKA